MGGSNEQSAGSGRSLGLHVVLGEDARRPSRDSLRQRRAPECHEPKRVALVYVADHEASVRPVGRSRHAGRHEDDDPLARQSRRLVGQHDGRWNRRFSELSPGSRRMDGGEPGPPSRASAPRHRSRLRRLGCELEGRAFRPHLTLARVRESLPVDRMRELWRQAKRVDYTTEFIVHSIDLMQSDLSSSGPRYTTLVSAPLRSS